MSILNRVFLAGQHTTSSTQGVLQARCMGVTPKGAGGNDGSAGVQTVSPVCRACAPTQQALLSPTLLKYYFCFWVAPNNTQELLNWCSMVATGSTWGPHCLESNPAPQTCKASALLQSHIPSASHLHPFLFWVTPGPV